MVDFISSSGSNSVYDNNIYSSFDNVQKTKPLSEDELIIRALDGLEEVINGKPLDEKENAFRSFIENEVADYLSDKIVDITGSEDISAGTEFLFITIDKYAPRVRGIAGQATTKPTLIINSQDFLPQSTDSVVDQEIDLRDPQLATTVKEAAAENIAGEVTNKVLENNSALERVLEKIRNGEDLTEEDLKIISENQNLLKELQELSALFKEHGLQITLRDRNGNNISLDQMVTMLTEKQEALITQITSELQVQITEQVIENQSETYSEPVAYSNKNTPPLDNKNDNPETLRNQIVVFKSLIINTYQEHPDRLNSIISEFEEMLPDSELKKTIINSLNNSIEIAVRKNTLRNNTVNNINKMPEILEQKSSTELLTEYFQPKIDVDNLSNNPQTGILDSVIEYTEDQIKFINILNSFKLFIKKAIEDSYKFSSNINQPIQDHIQDPDPKPIKEKKENIIPAEIKHEQKYPSIASGQSSEIEQPRQVNEFTNSNLLLRESLSVLEDIFENPAEIVKYDFNPTKFKQLIYSIKETLNNMIRNNDVLMYFNKDTVKQLVKIKSILNLLYVDLARVSLANDSPPNNLNPGFMQNQQNSEKTYNNYSNQTTAAINSSQSLPVLAQALLEKIKALLKTIMPPLRVSSSKPTTKRRDHSEESPEDRPNKSRQKTNPKNITEI